MDEFLLCIYEKDQIKPHQSSITDVKYLKIYKVIFNKVNEARV